MRTLNLGDTYPHMRLKMKVIRREGDVVMAYNGACGYEVFKIRRHKKREVLGRKIDEGEYPPSANQFGKWAYSFSTRGWKEAEEAFEGLVNS